MGLDAAVMEVVKMEGEGREGVYEPVTVSRVPRIATVPIRVRFAFLF